MLVHELVVALDADDPDLVTRPQGLRIEYRFLHGRFADACRVVGDDGVVVQRVQLFDPAFDLERSGKRDAHVADGNWYRVAVNEDIAPLLVDDQAGAVVVTVPDAGQRVRQVEGHNHE